MSIDGAGRAVVALARRRGAHAGISGEQVLTAVDRDHRAGNAGGRRADQEGGERANILDTRQFPARAFRRSPFQHLVEPVDAAGRARGDRARRDGVGANAFGSKFRRNVARRAFQRRLDRSHQVIVRDDTLGAVEGDAQEAAAVRHQGLWPGALRPHTMRGVCEGCRRGS